MTKNKTGDIVMLQMGAHRRPCKITGFVVPRLATMEEMKRDSLGRLRGMGEEGRFSTTRATAENAPRYRKR